MPYRTLDFWHKQQDISDWELSVFPTHMAARLMFIVAKLRKNSWKAKGEVWSGGYDVMHSVCQNGQQMPVRILHRGSLWRHKKVSWPAERRSRRIWRYRQTNMIRDFLIIKRKDSRIGLRFSGRNLNWVFHSQLSQFREQCWTPVLFMTTCIIVDNTAKSFRDEFILLTLGSLYW